MAAPIVNTTVTSSTTISTTTMLVIHDTKATDSTDSDLDVGFIIALVCFAIGGLLLLIGFIKVLVWYIDSRKHEKYSKWWLRQLEHRRHLEEYSIRTGEVASHYSAATSVHSLTNQGFQHEEEEEDDFRSHEPPGSPVATATQSAALSDHLAAAEQSSHNILSAQNGNISKPANSNFIPVMGGLNSVHRQDRNMNEIMDYL